MNSFNEFIRQLFKQWFHKRNIIIVSEHKVKHVSVGAKTQFFVLIVTAVSLCWGSYSTGSFMADRKLVKERTQALRSVTNARVQSDFNTLLQVSPIAVATNTGTPIGKGPLATSIDTGHLQMPSVLANDNLFSRIAFLEHKVSELQNANEAIIQRVQAKASGNIENLEAMIRQTGLDPEDLKKQVKLAKPKQPDNDADNAASAPAEGGPYIPDSTSVSPEASTMFSSLDQLAMLRSIVNTLPLGLPIHDAKPESPFGHRIDPFTGQLAFHSGLDLAGPYGAEIYAAADGTVTSAGINGPYGNAIDIDHGFNISTRYGHLSKILVEEGDKVHKGDLIALEGSTGRSTGPHLHYEVRYNDEPINPKRFLTAGEYVSKEQE